MVIKRYWGEGVEGRGCSKDYRGGWGGGGEVGCWSRIKYEISRMEHVEHNTDISHNVRN